MNLSDVAIIGAGPAGALAAKLLVMKGYSVNIIEHSIFPRFSIGESLLPHCMSFLQEADMLDMVNSYGFQYKSGALFSRNNKASTFEFNNKFTQGPASTFQVQRAEFDKLLADDAEKAGANIYYGEKVTAIDTHPNRPVLTSLNKRGYLKQYQAKFILDASGFGRVLPRLLDLERPSDFPARQSWFTHVKDNITSQDYDRSKISIIVHPVHDSLWYWLIPFSNGYSSVGIVGEPPFFRQYPDKLTANFQQLIDESPELLRLLKQAEYSLPVNQIKGYAVNVKQLWGDKFLLLGNAGEFLDPVFSSGVTIAMKSASLAANLLHDYFQGKPIDWQSDYADRLQKGINVFRDYVNAWYTGDLQNIIFYASPNTHIKNMICSILAGYAWDETNPYVKQSKKCIQRLANYCSK